MAKMKPEIRGDLILWGVMTVAGLTILWFVDWRLIPAMLLFFGADNLSETLR